MKVYVVTADTVTDCSGEVFSDGYVIGTFSSYEKASSAIEAIEENYTRKRRDYDIEEFEVDI
jgi:hypothetical protein